MSRVHVSTKRRLALFTEKKGICHFCGGRVQAREAWDLSHVIPLAAGGADDETNWDVAHRKCHRAHTAEIDIPTIAKVKRVRAKHLGAKAPSRKPLPGGRNSPLKRKINGTVEARHVR